MKNADRVKELLPTLSGLELKEIIFMSEFYRERKDAASLDINDELFYITLTEELSRRLSTSFPPLPLLKKNSAKTFKKFLQVSADFNNWIDKVFRDTTVTRLQRRRLYIIAIEIVVSNVENSKVPLSLTSSLNFFVNFPGLFNKSFPGYLESGMLGTLLEMGFFSSSDVQPEDNYDEA